MPAIKNIIISDDVDTLEYDVSEIRFAIGDTVDANEVLIVVESEKVSLEVATENAGIVQSIYTTVGSKVNGSEVLMTLEIIGASSDKTSAGPFSVEPQHTNQFEVDVVVIGAGPGGYTAAFRCADLGAKVLLVDKDNNLGGTCLNVGCIPSKALLHAAKVIQDVEESSQLGISFKSIAIDIHKLRSWKESIVDQLTGGIKYLATKRSIQVLTGNASFVSPTVIEVKTDVNKVKVTFTHAIIATGSYPAEHNLFDCANENVLSSANALNVSDIPARLLVVGCGVIGLELASVYQALGSRVVLTDITNSILFGLDKDLIDGFEKEAVHKYENIILQAKISEVSFSNNKVVVNIQKGDQYAVEHFDKVLIAIGRKPSSNSLKLDKIGIEVDERGFIQVNRDYQTSSSNIFAIGDVIGGPMLAHKALYEGKKAAEYCMNLYEGGKVPSIPAVVYTDPEIAWVGITEEQAKKE
ncbi:MAG: FAD-dependent oxidoreductase, partial [Gammaproteobacteria bacterium]